MTPAGACRNCGAAAPWNYCPNCGQETAIALPSAFAFLREAAGRYIRFDGRMWRSLHALLFRPGFLTPSRLGFDVDSDLNLTFDPGSMRWLAPLRARIGAFNRLPREAKVDRLTGNVFRYAPYAAIGLLPLFALLLGISYAGGGRRHPARPHRYAAHLVFGAHNHAFVFLVATVIVVVPYWPLRATLIVWSLIYAVVSLHNVYGGSWLGVVLRAITVTVVYALFFALAVAALIVAAIAFD